MHETKNRMLRRLPHLWRRHGWLIIGLLWIIASDPGLHRLWPQCGRLGAAGHAIRPGLPDPPTNPHELRWGGGAGELGAAGRAFPDPLLTAWTAIRVLVVALPRPLAAVPPALLARPRDHLRAEPQGGCWRRASSRWGRPCRGDRGQRGSRPARPLSRAWDRGAGRQRDRSRPAAPGRRPGCRTPGRGHRRRRRQCRDRSSKPDAVARDGQGGRQAARAHADLHGAPGGPPTIRTGADV